MCVEKPASNEHQEIWPRFCFITLCEAGARSREFDGRKGFYLQKYQDFALLVKLGENRHVLRKYSLFLLSYTAFGDFTKYEAAYNIITLIY